MNDIKEMVTQDGQPYVDDPVYAHPKRESLIAESIAVHFNSPRKKPVVIGHERVKLNWLKRGTDGKLIPR